MANESGMITLPGMGLKVTTSRGIMDAKALRGNFEALDRVSGSMNAVRYLGTPAAPWDPTALVDDTWTAVPLPNPIALAMDPVGPWPAEFDDGIRFSNVWKALCARLRVQMTPAGAPTGKHLWFQFLKSPLPAVAYDEALASMINPIEALEDLPELQNLSGFAKEYPLCPSLGADAEPLLLYVKKEAGWANAALIVEVNLAVQMLRDQPPAIILES